MCDDLHMRDEVEQTPGAPLGGPAGYTRGTAPRIVVTDGDTYDDGYRSVLLALQLHLVAPLDFSIIVYAHCNQALHYMHGTGTAGGMRANCRFLCLLNGGIIRAH